MIDSISIGEFFVFELKEGKLNNISVGFETINDASSFSETMKEGMYYKSMRPDIKLVVVNQAFANKRYH